MHREGHHADERAALEGVDVETRRQTLLDRLDGEFPVKKEDLPPPLEALRTSIRANGLGDAIHESTLPFRRLMCRRTHR